MKSTSTKAILGDGREYTLMIKDYFIVDEQVTQMMKGYGYSRKTKDPGVLSQLKIDKNTQRYLVQTGIIE